MKKPDWKKAHKAATQWDTKFSVFCNKRGFWDSYGDFTIYHNEEEWNTSRYAARPTEWYGEGWPPIGWHGQFTWGSKVDWFECIIMPDKSICIKDQKSERWRTSHVRFTDNPEFKALYTSKEQERIDIIDYAVNVMSTRLVKYGVENLYDLGMLVKGKMQTTAEEIKTMNVKSVSLGDGAYASKNENGDLYITANHENPSQATDTVIIGGDATLGLVEFIQAEIRPKRTQE